MSYLTLMYFLRYLYVCVSSNFDRFIFSGDISNFAINSQIGHFHDDDTGGCSDMKSS